MRVGFFVGNFLPGSNFGGGEVVAYNLAREISKKHEVLVFSSGEDRKNSTKKLNDKMVVYNYSTLFKIYGRKVSLNLIFKPLKEKVDIAHVHIMSSPIELISVLLYAKKRKVPLMATYHGDTIAIRGGIVYKMSVKTLNYFVRKVLENADVIISPSEHYIEESKLLKNYKNKIKVIPNGIHLENFNIPISREEIRKKLNLPNEIPIVLFFSTLHPKKGPDVLLKAMKFVLTKKDAMLLICGEGIMRNELQKLAKKLNIDKFVRFEGFVSEELKPLYFKASDIFVLPSTMSTEVFPVALLEASAAGLPMVVSDLKTFGCIVEDGYNGAFTRKGDEKSLADTIIYLLDNEDERKRMGRNAKEKVKDFTWDKIAENYEKIYEELL
ncbi:MAG: glycosyltransferase family 4 protein [Elusimicrobiota bacterium]|nr:glycosyltransferase family 4 protein [Endomicrobiia bacterium]MDW8166258.1 glycosyltransferase family 4 protein [Elusimicrobiota bacterium]